MGTFHDDMGELHGITVVALSSDTVYVGRCHEMTADRLEMLDVDLHAEGQDGRTNDEYLERAAKFGVWKKHDRLILPLAEIQNVVPLGNYYKGVGSVPASVAAPVAEAPRTAPEPVVPSTAVSDEAPVSLTSDAVAEVKRLLAEEENRGQGLRLGVSGGGCSGLVYNVEFDGRKEGDLVIDQDGFEIFLDRKSIIYLRGVILEFQKGLSGRGFQFRNPNASNTCGCGESFAV
jgi:iron-sulfur cluster assembly protein